MISFKSIELLMDVDAIMAFQMLLAFVLGLVVGIEREYHYSPAGIRTYSSVCVGACLFGIISAHAHAVLPNSIVDPSRIAAQIVTGVGFLGAGIIFREGAKTTGLTTAATIWTSAAIGLAVAFHLFFIAILTTFMILFLLSMNYFPFWIKFKAKLHRKRPESAESQ